MVPHQTRPASRIGTGGETVIEQDMPFELVADGLAFPEGPVVMADGSVIVVEIAAGRVTRCWNDRKEVVCETGGGPNGAAIGPDGALYVCNNGGLDPARNPAWTDESSPGRIERIDLATGRCERIYEACGGHPLSAPNDLIFDADGRLWFTDLGRLKGRARDLSGLYLCEPDGSSIIEVIHGAVSFNGVGLSPDGKTVYVADTMQARVLAFDAVPKRSRARLVATVPGLVGLDSLAVTAAGNICVARLREGGIATVTPDGQVSTHAFPDSFTTNIAFGGADMRDAYITLSGSGRLVRTRWPEPGLRLHFNG
jgi:gluconolactonase